MLNINSMHAFHFQEFGTRISVHINLPGASSSLDGTSRENEQEHSPNIALEIPVQFPREPDESQPRDDIIHIEPPPSYQSLFPDS